MSVTDHAALLRYAAERAVRAPSIHNTQPWRFVLTGDALEIHADRTRGLEVLDPRGRQLTISCGCALYNARVSIGDPQDRPGSADLDRAIDHRRTNRRPFAGEPVPDWLITELVSAARAEQTVLLPITEPAHRSAVARLNTEADQVERADPKYLDELAVWTTDDPRRLDGVHAASVPYAGPHPEALDPLPVRNFDVRGMGWLPPSSESGPDQCLLLLCSDQDDPRGWLRAGEALEHVWLTLTEHGFWASPLSQLIEVRGTHDQLQLEMGLTAIPQTLLRVGRAPETVATPRRPIADVVTDLH